MAQSVTITIQNDAKAIILLDAFCYRFGYQEDVPNPAFDDQQPEDPQTNPLTIPNPQTKKSFLKEMTIDWWINTAGHGQRKMNEQAVNDVFNEGNIVID